MVGAIQRDGTLDVYIFPIVKPSLYDSTKERAIALKKLERREIEINGLKVNVRSVEEINSESEEEDVDTLQRLCDSIGYIDDFERVLSRIISISTM